MSGVDWESLEVKSEGDDAEWGAAARFLCGAAACRLCLCPLAPGTARCASDPYRAGAALSLAHLVRELSGIDVSEIIRLCLCPLAPSTARFALDPYRAGAALSLVPLVQELSGIEVLEARVCAACAGAAAASFHFVRRCRAAHAVLLRVLACVHAALPALVALPASSAPRACFLFSRPDDSSLTILHKGAITDANAAATCLTRLHRRKSINKKSGFKKEKKEDSEDSISDHLEARSNTLTCEACCTRHASRRRLRRHVRRAHDATQCCALCGAPAPTRRARLEHVRTTCAAAVPCSHCDLRFFNHKGLHGHIYKAHGDSDKIHREFVCSDCGKTFTSVAAVRQHEESHQSRSCPLCGKMCSNRRALSMHLQRTCSVPIAQLPAAERFMCDHCGKTLNRKQSLVTHLKTMHSSKSHACAECGKRFRTKGQLKGHGVVHTRERPARCDVCGRAFITKHALLYHSRLHTGERPHVCDLCGEGHLSSSRLLAHKRARHWGPGEQCPVCFGKFYTKYSLRVHVRRHSDPNSKLYYVAPDAPS